MSKYIILIALLTAGCMVESESSERADRWHHAFQWCLSSASAVGSSLSEGAVRACMEAAEIQVKCRAETK